MEVIGFLLLMIGAAGMDTEGKLWYVAASMIIVGCFLMLISERRRQSERINEVQKRSRTHRKRTQVSKNCL